MIWVKITAGPEWAIGLIGKLVGEFIEFNNHMMEPHWYKASDFQYKPA